MELIGIIAAIFELLAVYLLGSKKALGFVSGLICNVLWIGYVLITWHTWGLLIVCTGAFVLNIRGMVKWGYIKKGFKRTNKVGLEYPPPWLP